MLRLVMRRGPTPGVVYDLTSDEITIGRGAKNHIVIQDNQVSRDHCKLVRMLTDYELQDLDSESGTYVNGQRVLTSLRLQPGTLIELGDSITFEYSLSDSPNGTEFTPVGLMMTHGPASGYLYALEDKVINIGRDLSNDIVIQDAEVSRFHLRMCRTRRGYTIEDLSSTNGTFVNGEPLTFPRDLEVDDVVKLGTQIELQFVPRSGHDNDDPMLRPTANAEPRDDTLYDFLTRVLTRAHSERRQGRLISNLQAGELRDHIYLIYAREDWNEIVASLLVSLQDAGVKTWVDQHLPVGSDGWGAEVEQALHECWLMVVVTSPRALTAPHVRMIYRHFIALDKPVIPLVTSPNVMLPGELARRRSIMYDGADTNRGFQKLVYEIRQLRLSSGGKGNLSEGGE